MSCFFLSGSSENLDLGETRHGVVRLTESLILACWRCHRVARCHIIIGCEKFPSSPCLTEAAKSDKKKRIGGQAGSWKILCETANFEISTIRGPVMPAANRCGFRIRRRPNATQSVPPSQTKTLSILARMQSQSLLLSRPSVARQSVGTRLSRTLVHSTSSSLLPLSSRHLHNSPSRG